MPELPEVETTRRGIAPHLEGQTIRRVTVRQPQLRWPVPGEVQTLSNAAVTGVARRAKFLLLDVPAGQLLMHLGMSGSLRVLPAGTHIQAGFSMAWQDGQVTFASIRGAGHLLPLYRPAAAYTMMHSFQTGTPLPPPFWPPPGTRT